MSGESLHILKKKTMFVIRAGLWDSHTTDSSLKNLQTLVKVIFHLNLRVI